MATFLLIHGAWHGAWCWHKVVAELKSRGHEAVAIDLPGHGIDRTPPGEVTLAHYVERVGAALETIDGPVVLVGHSMGGMVLSAAGERYAERLCGLIYLAAIVLCDGESMLDNPVKASPREFMAGFRPRPDGTAVDYSQEFLREVFYADCSAADIELARVCLVPQPAQVMRTPIELSAARWGAIPRSYIACRDDHALTLTGQHEMLSRVGFDRIVEMPTSHSPFFSRPAELAGHLEALAG